MLHYPSVSVPGSIDESPIFPGSVEGRREMGFLTPHLKNDYQSLVYKYKNDNRMAKKFGMSSSFIQIGILSTIYNWKYVGIGYNYIAIPVLFASSIYYLVKDFLVLHTIEGNLAQMILEGAA